MTFSFKAKQKIMIFGTNLIFNYRAVPFSPVLVQRAINYISLGLLCHFLSFSMIYIVRILTYN